LPKKQQLPDLGTNYAVNIATIFGWGELIFMFWLLFKGTKLTKIKENS